MSHGDTFFVAIGCFALLAVLDTFLDHYFDISGKDRDDDA